MKIDENTKNLVVNYPVKKVLDLMEYWILRGVEVHLKFTCKKCRTRCMTQMPNAYFVEGYECSECGTKNVPKEFGLMLIKKGERKMNDVQKILCWLGYLYYSVGRQYYDFQLQIFNSEGIKTSRKTYREVCFDPTTSYNKWFLSEVNQRQVLPFEVLIDLETKDNLLLTIKKLKELGVEFYVFDTHSRGVHISIFFKRDLSEKEKLIIITFFGGDTQLASNKHMIALEFAEHHKSKKIKSLINVEEILNGN